jgi:hypothetical protein
MERYLPRFRSGSPPVGVWIFPVLAIFVAIGIRARLGDMPLERDEGEYAYAGQLILRGEAPYRDAFNMKLPGTYLAYAASMAVFGQTPTGIHLGLALVNAATIWLIFLLGKKLIDPVAGAVAAVMYALMSLSPDVLGLAGHATHYVVLPAVGGFLLLLRAIESKSLLRNFLAGALFGVAVLMKQHGVFFGVFAIGYLIWVRWLRQFFDDQTVQTRKSRRAFGTRKQKGMGDTDWAGLARELVLLAAGCLAPYGLVCLWLWAAGVFPQFWFWTVTYGSQYAAGLPLVKATDMVSYTLRAVVGPNLIFWMLPWVGMLMMWWDERLDLDRRFLLLGLLLASVAAITVGFYFRQHYFILLLPILSILIGLAVSRSLRLLQGEIGLESFLALGVICVAGLAGGAILMVNGPLWFNTAPAQVVERIYQSTVFNDTRTAAGIIASNTPPEARIAVIGSEPQIYFYTRRKSATGHIYTYALMEPHPYARRMQEEMIREIETTKPEYVVYVNNNLSWLTRPESDKHLFDWWPKYWEENLNLVRTLTTRQGEAEFAAKDPKRAGSTGNYLLLLKRKS